MAKKRKQTAKKSMEEKGISPLIATVLLIGFTVALAAIIITWGGRFIGTTTERVETQTEAQLTCTEVDFKITDVKCSSVSGSEPNVTMTIDNRASVEIASLIFRLYKDDETVVVTNDLGQAEYPANGNPTYTKPLGAFNVGAYNVSAVSSGDVIKKVEAIPKISIGTGTSPQSCSQMVESFELPTTPACTV